MAIIVMLKIDQFRLQIGRGPEQGPVEVLAPHRADESFYQRMRKRHVRNRFDFLHFEYSKIGLPLVESIQRIMIRAEVFGQTLPANRSMKHPAQRHSIHDAAVDAKPDDASRKLVHHNENPMCSQGCRFALEQIAAPQTVLHVTEKGEPGRTSRIRFRPVMDAQDAANNILVDLDAESQRDLLGNAGAAPVVT